MNESHDWRTDNTHDIDYMTKLLAAHGIPTPMKVETCDRCNYRITMDIDARLAHDTRKHVRGHHILAAIDDGDFDTDVIKQTFTEEVVFDGDPHAAESKIQHVVYTYVVDDYFS